MGFLIDPLLLKEYEWCRGPRIEFRETHLFPNFNRHNSTTLTLFCWNFSVGATKKSRKGQIPALFLYTSSKPGKQTRLNFRGNNSSQLKFRLLCLALEPGLVLNHSFSACEHAPKNYHFPFHISRENSKARIRAIFPLINSNKKNNEYFRYLP